MMTQPMSFSRALNLRRVLPALFLALAGSVIQAGGGGGTTPIPGANGSVNASSPGDEVTSLPLVEDPSGLTLIGRLSEIRALVLSVEGSGAIYVQRFADGQVSVTLMGGYRLERDRSLLARSNVQVLFRGGQRFQGGLAQLSILGSVPEILPAEGVPLPFVRLARSGAQGVGLELDVVSPSLERARGAAFLGRDRVVWVQRAP